MNPYGPPPTQFGYPPMMTAPPVFGSMAPLPIPGQVLNAAPATIEKPPVLHPTLDKATTAFIGSIPDAASDSWLETLFKILGPAKWTRVVDISNAPLNFGFVSFESAYPLHFLLQAVARESRTEPGAPLVPNPFTLKNGTQLLIKVDVGARTAAVDQVARVVAEKGIKALEEEEKVMKEKVEKYLRDTGMLGKEAPAKVAGSGDADQFLESIGVTTSSGNGAQPSQSQGSKPAKRPYTEETDEEVVRRLEKREREMHQAYLERMSRFERTESQRIQHITQTLSSHTLAQQTHEHARHHLQTFLSTFDDDAESARQEHDYFRDRTRWIHTRSHILRKERESDTRDRLLEREERARHLAQELESTRADRERLSAERAEAEERMRLEQIERERMERLRQEREVEMIERQKEVYHAVASGGHGIVVGRIMTMEERKKAIEELVASLPTELEAVCAWDVKWEFLEGGGEVVLNKIRGFVGKKVVEALGEADETVVDFVMTSIGERKGARYLVDELVKLLDDEAAVFVCKLWRMVMYESESRARGLA